MNDEERQRTMDFILQQQAQFTVGMQKLEEVDARASKRLDRLERYLRLMGRRFRRGRNELDERMTALINAQIRSEDKASGTEDLLKRLEESHARSEERLTRLEGLTARNSEDIAALAKVVANMARGRNGDDAA
jgi:hypothetical protein